MVPRRLELESASAAPLGVREAGRWLLLALWLAVMATWMAPSSALAREPEVQQLDVQRTSDGGVEASVRLGLQAPSAVKDALERGVPLYFVWQADVYRPRWYWWDKRVAGSQRAYRLLYQPLTRRWRMSLSSNPGTEQQTGAGLVYALHQTYDSLPQALASLGRVNRWDIAEPGQLAPDEEYRVVISFRLDLALLPRPLQLGVADENGWQMEWRREMVLGVWHPTAVGTLVPAGHVLASVRLDSAAPGDAAKSQATWTVQ